MAEISPTKPDAELVVFTDLDGTLLDHETYSFSPALEALDLLKSKGVPLILCSSKTRAEIELIQLDIGLRHPFISENGAAVFIPRGYFPLAPEATRGVEGYEVLECGIPYRQLVETLHRISSELRIRVISFSDMSLDEVARDSKLPPMEARLAKLREYDEPFWILDSSAATRSRLLNALREAGLRCIRGGRYYHVTSVTDKGLAVRKLSSLYEQAWGNVLTVGLGDSPNDLPLLREVDIPIVVRNPAAGAATRLLRKVPTARISSAPGPRGWNETVLEVMRQRAGYTRRPPGNTSIWLEGIPMKRG
ncbi:MAG: HAD-IIB family hydrolase [Acidobacteria bacterium]|nr:HAD-IIB family hydrolase [Acidobacteriota bacterium]